MAYILITARQGQCIVEIESIPNVEDTIEITAENIRMSLQGKEDAMLGNFILNDRVSDVDSGTRFGLLPSFWGTKVRKTE